MKRWWWTFNIYLALFALLLAGAGCLTDSGPDKKKKGKEAAVLEFHLQVQWNDSEHTKIISLYRANPFTIRINNTAAIDPIHVMKAEIVEDQFGGFAMRVHFNGQGTRLLENISVGNRGSRLAIGCLTNEQRWLAAPLLDRRIQDGTLTFTPDATREEAEIIVKGINNVADKVKMKDF